MALEAPAPWDAPDRVAQTLHVEDVVVQFGGLAAVDHASLAVPPGRIVGLIGPNGAGKTTLFECVSGFRTPNRGSIRYGGEELVGLPAWDRARLGIGRTLQNVRLFPELTVFDNLRIAHHLVVDSDAVSDALSVPRSRAAEREIHEDTEALVDLVGMRYFRDKLAGDLSYGTLRMLEIACILALEPRFLLLDEPSAGISQKETEQLGPILRRIQAVTGSSILIIEHDMPLVMDLADEIYAMEAGRIIARGTPDEIAANDQVIESYLGAPEARAPQVAQRTETTPKEAPAEPMLEVRGLEVHYGKVQVLYEVDLDVYPGEVVALLGTNGAGKSTILRALSALVKPSRGRIAFEGQDITGMSAEAIVRLGIVHVPGGRGVFPTLTIDENLALGGFSRRRRDPAVRAALERVYEYFPRLAERRRQSAGTLSGGEQQMLALGRALLAKPRLLMIDEMSLGLAPVVVQQLVEIVERLHEEEGLTFVIVEQQATFALSFTDRAYFLEKGEVRFAGPSSELAAREDLLRSVFLSGAAAGLGV